MLCSLKYIYFYGVWYNIQVWQTGNIVPKSLLIPFNFSIYRLEYLVCKMKYNISKSLKLKCTGWQGNCKMDTELSLAYTCYICLFSLYNFALCNMLGINIKYNITPIFFQCSVFGNLSSLCLKHNSALPLICYILY